MPGIELLDKNGKAKELSSTEKIGAIKIAIDYCDPKLVQLLLGARYCQLWQYWLVRAIFNYDMLSLSKMANCELPLAITNEQLRYLADKEHIDVEELNSIQVGKKIEYCRKIEEFYGNDRILEIKRSPEGVQLESATGGSLVESMAKQIAGGHLQGYQNNNEGCNVSDSIIAAVNANFSQECKSMIDETIKECQQEVKDAKGVVSNLTNALREKVVELENREKNLSLKISTVKEGIIKKMQDNKFMDKDFVQSEYNKLLDYYFQSSKYAGKAATADEEENPLHKYIQSEEMTNEAKNSLRKSYMYYGFGDCIDYAAQKFRDGETAEQKEGYLNIVRVLAVNGAHSESLIHTFDTEELKKIAQQSIFTVAKKAYEVLFDFDRSDEAKFMSTIVGEDGKFADHVNQNVRIFEYSGSPIVKAILDKLRKVERELQENRRSGKANRETGLFNAIYYTVSDSIGKLFGKECEPQTKEEHAQVYKALYEALDISYLAMATGDDRVLIDYAEEIESRIKKESNRGIVKVHSVLYSLFKDYKITRGKGDPTSNTGKWQRLWYHFQDIFHTYHNDVREDRRMKFLRIAMYATEIISEEYEEYQRQRFTTKFRNIDVQFLPGNCLINWLGATKEGVQKSEKESDKQKDKHLEQKTQEVKQEAQRAEQETKRANKFELKNTVMKLIRGSIRKLKFDNELCYVVEDNEENIVEKVVQHVMNHKSPPQQVLSAVMEEIRINRDQIVKEGKVSDEIIERNILNQSTSLSNVNVSQGAGLER